MAHNKSSGRPGQHLCPIEVCDRLVRRRMVLNGRSVHTLSASKRLRVRVSGAGNRGGPMSTPSAGIKDRNGAQGYRRRCTAIFLYRFRNTTNEASNLVSGEVGCDLNQMPRLQATAQFT